MHSDMDTMWQVDFTVQIHMYRVPQNSLVRYINQQQPV